MKATRYYQVAEHIFSVITEPAHLTLMQNYEPFRCSDSGDAVFTLTIDSGEAPAYTEETRQEDEGQAQRIAIARGLLHGGDILLLDEISSSLDEETERELYHRIFTTYPNKTMIFITHRATVCELCDESISLMPTR